MRQMQKAPLRMQRVAMWRTQKAAPVQVRLAAAARKNARSAPASAMLPVRRRFAFRALPGGMRRVAQLSLRLPFLSLPLPAAEKEWTAGAQALGLQYQHAMQDGKGQPPCAEQEKGQQTPGMQGPLREHLPGHPHLPQAKVRLVSRPADASGYPQAGA